MELSSNRNPGLLKQLKSTALPSLIEMAKWDPGHAEEFKILLGRIAGLEEAQIHRLIGSGKVNEILAAVKATP